MFCECCGGNTGINENRQFKENSQLLVLCGGCYERALLLREKYGTIRWEEFRTARAISLHQALTMDEDEFLMEYDGLKSFQECYEKELEEEGET